MTAPPLPTFVPQDAWYNLTTGQINPSVADTVPDITYLRPSSTPLGDVDGLVGSLDSEVLYLAGLSTPLDGGQKWLMWDEDSLEADNGETIFCPFADTSSPGRWKDTGTSGSGPGVLVSTQIITAGGSKSVAVAATPIVQVFIKGRSTPGATTLALPGSTFLGQRITVKDANGDATTANIIVTAPSIDGETSDTLTISYAERSYVWNGTEWSMM